MATGLQIRNIIQILQGGYPGENPWTEGGYANWTNVPLTGSAEVTYYYRDSGYQTEDPTGAERNANSSTVKVVVRDSWSAHVNSANNHIVFDYLTTEVVSVTRQWTVGAPGHFPFNIFVYDDQGGTLKATASQDYIDYDHSIPFNPSLPVTISRVSSIDIHPETEWGQGSVYYRNNWGDGHHDPGQDDDPTSIYIDRFFMGSQFRNVLPDRPNAPTASLSGQSSSDCDKITATVAMTQQWAGQYSTMTTYARHKIGNGSWSGYTAVMTNRSNGTYIIQNIPAGSTVYVEAYTTGDGTTSPTTAINFTVYSKPPAPTITFGSQTAEATQTSLVANLTYSGDGSAFMYRVKVGDKDWSDWQRRNTNSGSITLTGLAPDRTVQVQGYMIRNGLCGASTTTTFTTPRSPKAPLVQGRITGAINSRFVDNGSCIDYVDGAFDVNIDDKNYYIGLSAKGGKSVDLYWSYSIDNGAWTEWTKLTPSAWVLQTIPTLSCLPYGAKLCFRSYTVGYVANSDSNGLRGPLGTLCLTAPEKPSGDDPYTGNPFVMTNLCNSLLYLAELICQEWNAIKEGERTIYTNEEHKAACEGDPNCNEDPTLHSMLSRVFRFYGAIMCLICDGLNDSLNHLKRGAVNTYYAMDDGDYYGYGEYIMPDDRVTEDSQHLASSGAIYDAIDEFIHTAYRYVGNYAYLTLNPTTLNSVADPKNGDKALVKNGATYTNQIYTYNGTSWVAGAASGITNEGYPDRFAMIHVNKDSDWTYQGQSVKIPAGSGWYWYMSNWNQLDAMPGSQTADIEHLLSVNIVTTPAGDETTKLGVLPRSSISGSMVTPTDKTIYFITEEI